MSKKQAVKKKNGSKSPGRFSGSYTLLSQKQQAMVVAAARNKRKYMMPLY